MKTLILTILCSVVLSMHAQQWGNQHDGTYVNPILPADYSDPDAIRVGDDYYMVASDFHFMGMQVLRSRNLVDWTVVTQIYHRLDYPGWNENKHYAGGSWAPSIRYHGGRYWVYFCTPDEGLFMASAERAEGPWTPLCMVKKVEKWEDPCPFWDNEGNAYLGHSVHGAGPIIVHRMSADGTQLLDDGVEVYRGPVAEGTKFYVRNGWTYLCIPEGGVSTGWQTCLRSRSVYGPYERKIVLEQGSTAVNGPHQGSLIEGKDGRWWFLHFQESSPLGRIVHLQPVRWKDDWPLIGQDYDGNGIGEPVRGWTMPGESTSDSILMSDSFDKPILNPIWQWNHNPDGKAWKLQNGSLITSARKSPSFIDARNTLTQKIMGYHALASVTIHLKGMADGQRTGLACMGKINHLMGVAKKKGQLWLYEERHGKVVWEQPYTGTRLTIYLHINTHENVFSFECDGTRGSDFHMQNGFWKGARVALFNYNTENNKGISIFENFNYESK